MAEKEVLLTQNGLQKLEEELDFLKTTKRREVAERIKVAISYGDISENSEYDDAKNEQAFIEGRIITLEKMLRNARIISGADAEGDLIAAGVTVVIKDLEFGDVMEYTIVGSAEADPNENKISNESPVGRALLGRGIGDKIIVNVPVGAIEYEILEIKK